MSGLGVFTKQPAERLDVSIDFSDWLADLPGDSLVSAVSEVDDSALVIDMPIVSSQSVQQWYSGGVDRARYKITVTVTTALGRIKEVELFVRVRET